jgi:hypothetical protein
MCHSATPRVRRLASGAVGLLASACLLLSSLGCGLSMNGDFSQTSVTRLTGEDLAWNCTYDLTVFTPPQVPLKAVLVIFDRGDSYTLFDDPDVQQFAQNHQLAMLFPHECNAASYPDIQADAARGPGRSLFAALTQFAAATGHPELATANLLVFGFSAAGVLTATLSNYAPDRILGAMEYADGSAYLNIAALPIPTPVLGIPTLLMGNADDNLAGTYANYLYFQRGRVDGARWAYAVQHGTGHCCTDSAKPIILPWMDAVLNLRARGGSTPALLNSAVGSTAAFVCSPDGFFDFVGNPDCDFSYAAIGPGAAARGDETAWLPNPSSAQAWLTWVNHPSTN